MSSWNQTGASSWTRRVRTSSADPDLDAAIRAVPACRSEASRAAVDVSASVDMMAVGDTSPAKSASIASLRVQGERSSCSSPPPLLRQTDIDNMLSSSRIVLASTRRLRARCYATLSETTPPPGATVLAPYEVFDRNAKRMQRDRASVKDGGERSRLVDYLRREVAERVMERFEVRLVLELPRARETQLTVLLSCAGRQERSEKDRRAVVWAGPVLPGRRSRSSGPRRAHRHVR